LYLSQNYFKLPCQTLRENANFFCLFPQDQKNIDHIFNDHVSQNMTKEEFKKLCKTTWSKPHNFVVIDLTSPKREREREFIGTNIKQFHAKMKLRRWDTEKNLQEVVSSGAPRKFHKFLLWFKVDGRISANLMRL